MRPPKNCLEWAIYDWMRDSGYVTGGQEVVARAAYELAEEIANKMKVDVNCPIGDWADGLPMNTEE